MFHVQLLLCSGNACMICRTWLPLVLASLVSGQADCLLTVRCKDLGGVVLIILCRRSKGRVCQMTGASKGAGLSNDRSVKKASVNCIECEGPGGAVLHQATVRQNWGLRPPADCELSDAKVLVG
jgi:hypothetical protein